MTKEISLALGGGGAKGNSHIGVIRGLERDGYIIRSVAGTSFGGVVGILYALGNSPLRIQEMFESVDQNHLYSRHPDDGPSLLGLSGVRKWLSETVGDKTFEDLKIPAAVTAVDVNSGLEVIISSGLLKDAILSTIALPGIFPPHRLDGLELMDGGVVDPVPVTVARMLSPNLPVIAVVLNDPLDKPVRMYNIPIPSALPKTLAERIGKLNFAQAYDIFMRAVDISNRSLAHYRLALDAPDLAIYPDVHNIDLLDKVVIADVVKIGEKAYEGKRSELARIFSWGRQLRNKLFGTKR